MRTAVDEDQERKLRRCTLLPSVESIQISSAVPRFRSLYCSSLNRESLAGCPPGRMATTSGGRVSPAAATMAVPSGARSKSLPPAGVSLKRRDFPSSETE